MPEGNSSNAYWQTGKSGHAHPSQCLRFFQKHRIILWFYSRQLSCIILHQQSLNLTCFPILGFCCQNCTDIFTGNLFFLFRFWRISLRIVLLPSFFWSSTFSTHFHHLTNTVSYHPQPIRNLQ